MLGDNAVWRSVAPISSAMEEASDSKTASRAASIGRSDIRGPVQTSLAPLRASGGSRFPDRLCDRLDRLTLTQRQIDGHAGPTPTDSA